MTDLSPRQPLSTRLLKPHRLLPMARLFVVSVALSLILGVAWMIDAARDARLQEAQSSTSNLAYALARHAQDTLIKADTVLVGLVERLQTDGQGPAAMPRLERFMKLQTGGLSQLLGLFAFDRDGNWLANSFNHLPSGVNNSDREYFQFHRDNPGSGPHVGLPVRSRTTGDWIIPVSRRVDDAQGQFAGVVLAAINMSYFQQFYDTFDLKDHGAITLARDDGTLLVRQPYLESMIGKKLSSSPIFSTYLRQQPVGNARFVSVMDGVERLYSYRHLEGYPLVVTAALSRDEALASWRSESYRQAAATLFVVVLLGLFGFYLIRLIKSGMLAAEQLRSARDSLETLNQRLEKLALEDELTGLANRRCLMARLDEEVLRATRHQRPLALVLLDVDHFKQFNDLYGHNAGDECLRNVAQALRCGQKRPGDLAARYGGEEFCVLLPETDAAGAESVAELIRHTLQAQHIVHAGSSFGVVTISAGLHVLVPSGEGESAAALLHCADRALYQAKAAGRNRVRRFDLSLFKEKL
ncbi:sensor domain-containing diguanylate cyclase [Pseudomonas sp. LS44]|uniref:sensor domain-containing diguanylate cyclase n=1 Tax=Pseudomonas sp. LS44 TaxID=1357074 RepID=UPI00215A815E|nr:sensor domain-containing diguanylate cyclase [Pseudomonas sp. LS44]UVE16959.1 sensor domain-containing diguanylate cyclase [Pseudomonas sp. LS44]